MKCNNLDCNYVLEDIVDYFDNNLTQNRQKEVERHLEECSACKAEYQIYSQTISSIKKAIKIKHKGITASNDFERWMRNALKDQRRSSASNNITEDATPDNTFLTENPLEDTSSEDTPSEDTLSEDTPSEDTLSVDLISGTILQASICSDNSVSEDLSREDTFTEDENLKDAFSADKDKLLLQKTISCNTQAVRNTRQSWKLALTAAIIVVMVAIFTFTPALAAIRNGIYNLIDFAMGDKGIISSMENGFGQVIERSDTDKDLKFTVHSFLSDENRTVALISASYNGSLIEKADNMTIYGLKITDKWGKNITDGYSSRFQYDNENMELSGNIDMGKVPQNKKDFVISFDSAVISKQETTEVPIKLTGSSMMNIKYTINLDSQTIKSLTLNNIIVSGKKLTIEYDVEYVNEIYMTGGHILSLLGSDGSTHYYNLGSASSRTEIPNVESIQDVYSIEGIDLETCKLQLNFAKPVSVIEGKWKVAFRAKEGLAKASTKTIYPDKTFSLGGYEFNVSKVVFSPSMTSVHVESTDISSLAVLGHLSLKSGNNITASSSSGHNTMQLYSNPPAIYTAMFSFDPVFIPENLSLVISSARIEGAADINIVLEASDENVGKIVDIDASEYKLNFRRLPGDIVEITLENLNIPYYNDVVIPNSSLFIIDGTNKKIPFIEGSNKYPDNKPINTSETQTKTYRFLGVEKGKIILRIESLIKYREVNCEVDLQD